MLKRALTTILVASVLLAGMPQLARAANGTAVPFVKPQYFDANGNPCSSCKLFTYVSGTSTKITTYTEATLSSANTNPIVLGSDGRASIFLTPGTSVKLVLAPSTDTDPPVAPLWSVDAVDAVPPNSTSSDTDVSGVAGETIAAGDLVYLSDGQGGRLGGSWYKMDADFAYASVEPPVFGFANAAAATFSTTTIRVQGRVTLPGNVLTAGLIYYASTSAGTLTTTPGSLARAVFLADGTTTGVIARDGYPRFSYPPVGVPTYARQTADVTKNNSTAFADLTGLSFAVPASSTWAFDYTLFCVSATAADIKFTLTGPAAPTAIRYGIISSDGTSSTAFGTLTSISTQGVIQQTLHLSGTLRNGVTAGTVQIQMAQLTADVSNTVCSTDSNLIAWRIN